MSVTRITTEVISEHSANSIQEALQEAILKVGANPGTESVRLKNVDVLFSLGQVAGYRVTLEVTYADELERTPEDEGEGFAGASQLELVRQHILLEDLTQEELVKSKRFLVITPAEKGSGSADVSVDHVRYLTDVIIP